MTLYFFYGPLPSARKFVSLAGYLVSHLPTHFNFSVYPHIYVIVHISICPDLPFFCYLFCYLVSIHFLHYTRSLDYSYLHYIWLERLFSR